MTHFGSSFRASAVLALCMFVSPASQAAQLRPIVLEGVTLIDGTGAPGKLDSAVLIDGGIIRAIGRTGHLAYPANTQRIALRGHFLMPGLIDMHAHVMVPRCTPGNQDVQFDQALSERMLGVLLRFGITTVRSPATPTLQGVAMREAVASGRVPGPRIFASAELINGRGQTADTVRAEVREHLRSPVDFIKLYGGLSPQALQAGVEEAHAHGRPVIAHLGTTSWKQAADMGVDFITHAASWSAGDLPADTQAAYADAQARRGGMRARIDWLELFDPEAPHIDALLADLARRKISIDPTLVAYDAKFLSPSNGRYRKNAKRAVVPEMLQDWIKCGTQTGDWTASDYERMRAAWPKLLRMVQRFHQSGVLLTAGSDVTNAWVIPGESLHQELELLQAAGIAPLQVLRIATSNGAQALGILNETGTVEVGKRADLLILSRDPSARIANIRSIRAVMQGGEWRRGPAP